MISPRPCCSIAVSAVLLTFCSAALGSMALAQKHACTVCHAADKKQIGPSFNDIRLRYANDPGALARLVAKTQGGGSGSFGAVPMPPQRHVPEKELNAIVQWMLEGN
jgi:cytochrome c551/c552